MMENKTCCIAAFTAYLFGLLCEFELHASRTTERRDIDVNEIGG